MSSVTKVVGGTVAAGTGTGVAGYGTYRYLTYETIRNLIEREDKETKLLSELDNKDTDWKKAADRYLVELTENPNLSNKLSSSVQVIGSDDDDDKLNGKREEFKKECLKILDSEVTEENKGNKDQAKTWCIKFESYEDQLKKETNKLADKDNTGWADKYAELVKSDGPIKTLLDGRKKGDESKKGEIAHWWCSLEVHKKYDSSKYETFKNECVTVAAS